MSNLKRILPDYTYYYGFTKEEVVQLSDMPYKQAIEHKIKCAKALLRRLLNRPFTEQDTARVNDVHKSIGFNNKLLEELRY